MLLTSLQVRLRAPRRLQPQALRRAASERAPCLASLAHQTPLLRGPHFIQPSTPPPTLHPSAHPLLPPGRWSKTLCCWATCSTACSSCAIATRRAAGRGREAAVGCERRRRRGIRLLLPRAPRQRSRLGARRLPRTHATCPPLRAPLCQQGRQLALPCLPSPPCTTAPAEPPSYAACLPAPPRTAVPAGPPAGAAVQGLQPRRRGGRPVPHQRVRGRVGRRAGSCRGAELRACRGRADVAAAQSPINWWGGWVGGRAAAWWEGAWRQGLSNTAGLGRSGGRTVADERAHGRLAGRRAQLGDWPRWATKPKLGV